VGAGPRWKKSFQETEEGLQRNLRLSAFWQTEGGSVEVFKPNQRYPLVGSKVAVLRARLLHRYGHGVIALAHLEVLMSKPFGSKANFRHPS
jgi:hypothetical protein